MSFGAFEQDQAQVIAEINTTPLIDVLLVLLVVFLVTLPLATAMVPIALPETEAPPAAIEPAAIQLSIDAKGQIFWEDQPISLDDTVQRFSKIDNANTPLRLRIDSEAKFDTIAKVLAAANQHHITQIGFVTVTPKGPQ